MSRPAKWYLKLRPLHSNAVIPTPHQERLESDPEYREALLLLPHRGACLVYPGATVNGYPAIRVNGRLEYLHSIYWKLFHQREPRGQLRRACASPCCVNPLHWVDVPKGGVFDFEPLRTPINTPFSEPPLPASGGACANTTNSPDCPTEFDDIPMTGASDSYPDDSVKCQNSEFSYLEIRTILRQLIEDDEVPRNWDILREHVPEFICNNDDLIKIILSMPKITETWPEGWLDKSKISSQV